MGALESCSLPAGQEPHQRFNTASNHHKPVEDNGFCHCHISKGGSTLVLLVAERAKGHGLLKRPFCWARSAKMRQAPLTVVPF